MAKIDVYRVHLNANNTIPLALGNVVATVKQEQPALLEQLNFQTPWLTHGDMIQERSWLETLTQPAIFLMSDYVWNTQAHLALSRALKAINPQHIIIHGGPSTPYHTDQFLREHECVDFLVQGEGEFSSGELLQQLCTTQDYQRIKGIVFRRDQEVVMTAPRERIEALSHIPSPYLGGEFDMLLSTCSLATVETNRGCPFKCTYCSWGGYLKKIVKQDLDRVFAELEWVAMHRIPTLLFADANFGLVEQDLIITEQLCKLKARYGFPQNIIINQANDQRRSIEISRMFIAARILTSLSIAIQTTDQQTLHNIHRKPMSDAYYQTLWNEYTRYQLPVTLQLLLGLPGSTYATVKQDLNRAVEEKMFPMIFTAIILPNSPMNESEYRAQHRIVTEQFRSHDYPTEMWEVVVATNSFTSAEYRQMHLLCAVVCFAAGYRALKYVTYFVATEQQSNQIDVLELLLQMGLAELAQPPEVRRYPVLGEIIQALQAQVAAFFDQKIYKMVRLYPHELYARLDAENRWPQFYAEITEILQTHYGLEAALIETVMRVQQAILPSRHNTLAAIDLPYDFVAYYMQELGVSKQSLAAFARLSRFAVSDPKGFCQMVELAGNSPRFPLASFELDSPLRRNE